MFVHVQYAPLTHACVIHVHVYALLYTHSLTQIHVHACTLHKTCIYTHTHHTFTPPSIHTHTHAHTPRLCRLIAHPSFSTCYGRHLPSTVFFNTFNLAYLSMQCYRLDIFLPSSGLNLVTTAMLYLGSSTIALMFVSVYLSFILPSEYGIQKNPFFPIIGRLSKFGTST